MPRFIVKCEPSDTLNNDMARSAKIIKKLKELPKEQLDRFFEMKFNGHTFDITSLYCYMQMYIVKKTEMELIIAATIERNMPDIITDDSDDMLLNSEKYAKFKYSVLNNTKTLSKTTRELFPSPLLYTEEAYSKNTTPSEASMLAISLYDRQYFCYCALTAMQSEIQENASHLIQLYRSEDPIQEFYIYLGLLILWGYQKTEEFNMHPSCWSVTMDKFQQELEKRLPKDSILDRLVLQTNFAKPNKEDLDILTSEHIKNEYMYLFHGPKRDNKIIFSPEYNDTQNAIFSMYDKILSDAKGDKEKIEHLEKMVSTLVASMHFDAWNKYESSFKSHYCDSKSSSDEPLFGASQNFWFYLEQAKKQRLWQTISKIKEDFEDEKVRLEKAHKKELYKKDSDISKEFVTKTKYETLNTKYKDLILDSEKKEKEYKAEVKRLGKLAGESKEKTDLSEQELETEKNLNTELEQKISDQENEQYETMRELCLLRRENAKLKKQLEIRDALNITPEKQSILDDIQLFCDTISLEEKIEYLRHKRIALCGGQKNNLATALYDLGLPNIDEFYDLPKLSKNNGKYDIYVCLIKKMSHPMDDLATKKAKASNAVLLYFDFFNAERLINEMYEACINK